MFFGFSNSNLLFLVWLVTCDGTRMAAQWGSPEFKEIGRMAAQCDGTSAGQRFLDVAAFEDTTSRNPIWRIVDF